MSSILPSGFVLSVLWAPDVKDAYPLLAAGPFREPFSLSPQSMQQAFIRLAAHCWRQVELKRIEWERIYAELSPDERAELEEEAR